MSSKAATAPNAPRAPRAAIRCRVIAAALCATLVAFGVAPTPLSAADDAAWTWQVTPSPPEYLSSVDLADAYTGWVVGDNGTILKTADGATWEKQVSPTAEDLVDVCCLDVSVAWAVGKNGTIVRTEDGTNWRSVATTITGDLNAVRFVDAMTGWAAGNGVYKTTDGGETWTRQTCQTSWGSDAYVYDLDFLDANTGWAVGNGIFKTTDGGDVWFYQTNTAQYSYYSCEFVDPMTGWVGGDGSVKKTTTGGTVWFDQKIRDPEGRIIPGGIKSIQFVDSQTGWALPCIGGSWPTIILKTTNGGAAWTAHLMPQTNGLNRAHFADANTGYAVGYTGVIVKTSTGGTWWSASTTTLVSSASAVSYGGGVTLTARVRNPAGAGVAGRQVRFEKLSGTRWVLLGTATTGADGTARKWVGGIRTKTTLRARHAEAFPYRASTSASVVVKPRVKLTTPSAPSSVRAGRTFSVSGLISPRHVAGVTCVYLRFYRYEPKGWVMRGTLRTGTYNYNTSYSRYATSAWINLRGRWYVIATHSDSGHAWSVSGKRFVSVY